MVALCPVALIGHHEPSNGFSSRSGGRLSSHSKTTPREVCYDPEIEGELMGNLSGVVQHLKKELGRAKREVHQFTAALTALGSSHSNGRHTLSASARKRISLAQKARWAKAKGQAPKPKRTMSVAGRKRIAAAQRKRWAKGKAGQKKG